MSPRLHFVHQFIDAEGGYDGWGAVAVADFDGDGRPELATGGKGGGFYHLYDYVPDTGCWTRRVITRQFSPNVGAVATDVDGDGRPEIVCGEWGQRLLWLVAAPNRPDFGAYHVVGRGLRDPHDVLAADLDGDGRDEIIVREKHGRLLWYRIPPDAAAPWPVEVLAERLPGDGTAVAWLDASRASALVTNAGWFEPVRAGAARVRWARRPLIPDELGWHPESRVAVADVDGDGQPEVVLTESEIGPARLAVLHRSRDGEPWEAEVVLDRDLDVRALHSLGVADLDGDGRLEIVTAEMENGKTDGVEARPRWWALARDAAGGWQRHVLLDANLGTHQAAIGDFDGDGQPDIAGKVWRANPINGCGGRNHVDVLWNRSKEARASQGDEDRNERRFASAASRQAEEKER